MKLVKGRTLAALLASAPGPGGRPAAAADDLRAGLPDGRLRPRPGRDPPRPEAVQRHGRRLRRGPGHGLGTGQGAASRRRGGRRAVDERAGRDGHPDRAQRVRCRRLGAPGRVLGTPAYMPPEQARGEIDVARRAGRRVRAGGDPLRDPHRPAALSSAATRRRSSGWPPRPALDDALARLDACGADPELVALARDCLAADRENRPQDAGVVAERTTAYLLGVQERLHTAELQRVEAQARVEEEAKRRVLADQLAREAQARAAEARGAGTSPRRWRSFW